MTPQNDPIATAQALADHGAHVANDTLTRQLEAARGAGASKQTEAVEYKEAV
ncbi:MAG: hypothetical protein LCI00_16745 [Chloroflexi bacterium]|nr:hypothetical protein [Chloroflexota bacterium]